VRTCSEPELRAVAAELVEEIRAKTRGGRPRVILRGELGAGKSTFARAMLEAFGVRREAEGSPTFAIAHEYTSGEGLHVVHADGYRLKSEAELESTGLLETIWDPEAVVIFEWLSLFPETEAALRKSPLPTLWLHFGFQPEPEKRSLEIVRTGF
jgi:tRNA threonylcarbamoyl adenosine modification protein YjeE